MKCSDIMLSAMLHAGIVVGVMYGISHYENDPADEDVIEPVFFEILEESVMAADAPSKPEEQEEREPSVPLDDPQTDEPEAPVAEPMAETATEAVEAVKERNRPESEPVPPEPLPELPPQKPEDPVPETPSPERVTEPETAPRADREVAKVVSAPVACATIVPKYPRSARRRGREGTVTLEISVSDTGEVVAAEVVTGSGHRDLDWAAISAVRSARFVPAVEDGVNVSGSVRLTFEFRLR